MTGRPSSGPWHVSPAADAAAYHYSWLWLLIPLLLSGGRFPNDYLFLFCLVAAANVAHQTLTFPLALADRELFRRERTLFLAGPLLVLAATAAALLLSRLDFSAFLAVLGASALVSAAWNFWHVYMQKYGLLRLYNAKSSAAVKVPGWSDRLFVFAWLPLYFAVLGPRHRDRLLDMFPLMSGALAPLLDALSRAAAWLAPAAAALVAASLLSFAHHERRGGAASAPRLSMALGMTGLSASFLLFDPVKVALAFGFTHLVEYFVFVWAYERRRGLPRAGFSILAFAALSIGAFLVAVGWGRLISPGSRFPAAFGLPFDRIGTVFVVYQSLFHFHVDGRIWKVSRLEVRRDL